MHKVAIIGSSGNYGRAMIREFRKHHPSAVLLGLDVSDPPELAQPDEFLRCDARGAELREKLRKFQPDTVLHLAFVVDPIHDDGEMHSINVQGTRNVMDAIAELQPQRFLISSSATAYGAAGDNPIPMSEKQPCRSHQQYRYATDKVEVENLLADFSKANPDIFVSWTRPTIIYEKGLRNYLIDLITIPPVMVKLSGNDTELQFVHGDDVAAATLLILEKNAVGPFNIAPHDWIKISELSKMSNRFAFPVSHRFLKFVAIGWWGLRLPLFRFPPGLWDFHSLPMGH